MKNTRAKHAKMILRAVGQPCTAMLHSDPASHGTIVQGYKHALSAQDNLHDIIGLYARLWAAVSNQKYPACMTSSNVNQGQFSIAMHSLYQCVNSWWSSIEAHSTVHMMDMLPARWQFWPGEEQGWRDSAGQERKRPRACRCKQTRAAAGPGTPRDAAACRHHLEYHSQEDASASDGCTIPSQR